MDVRLDTKKSLLLGLSALTFCAILVGAMVFAVGFARSASAAPVTLAAALPGSAPTGGITVSATGKATGTPDALLLDMGVSVTAATVDDALAQANSAAKKVHDALLKSGVAAKDLQTAGLSIQPRYDNNGTQITGYVVDERVTATLRHLDSAGSVIGKAAEAGGSATRINNISLDLSDSSALLVTARAAAIAEAKTKAAQYAEAADRQLGDVVSISEVVTSNPVPYANFDRMVAGAAPSAVPIQAGSQDVGVTVTVVYAFR